MAARSGEPRARRADRRLPARPAPLGAAPDARRLRRLLSPRCTRGGTVAGLALPSQPPGVRAVAAGAGAVGAADLSPDGGRAPCGARDLSSDGLPPATQPGGALHRLRARL